MRPLRRAHAAARQLFGSLYSLGPGFADPDLEDEFLADFFTRMRLIMWLGALSGLLFTAARFVAVYLHIHHPGAHEKCCSSLAWVYDFEHADRELRVKAAETDLSVSELVNSAVRQSLAEDAEDLAAFRSRSREKSLDFEGVLKDLKRRGKL